MTNDDDPRSTNKRSLSKNFPRFPIVPLLRNYNLFLESGKLATMEKPNLKLPFQTFEISLRTGCSHFSPSSSSSVLFAHNAQLTNSNSNANSSLVLSSFSSLKKQTDSSMDSLFTRRTWHRSDFLPSRTRHNNDSSLIERMEWEVIARVSRIFTAQWSIRLATFNNEITMMMMMMMKRYPRFVSLFRSTMKVESTPITSTP